MRAQRATIVGNDADRFAIDVAEGIDLPLSKDQAVWVYYTAPAGGLRWRSGTPLRIRSRSSTSSMIVRSAVVASGDHVVTAAPEFSTRADLKNRFVGLHKALPELNGRHLVASTRLLQLHIAQ